MNVFPFLAWKALKSSLNSSRERTREFVMEFDRNSSLDRSRQRNRELDMAFDRILGSSSSDSESTCRSSI